MAESDTSITPSGTSRASSTLEHHATSTGSPMPHKRKWSLNQNGSGLAGGAGEGEARDGGV